MIKGMFATTLEYVGVEDELHLMIIKEARCE